LTTCIDVEKKRKKEDRTQLRRFDNHFCLRGEGGKKKKCPVTLLPLYANKLSGVEGIEVSHTRGQAQKETGSISRRKGGGENQQTWQFPSPDLRERRHESEDEEELGILLLNVIKGERGGRVAGLRLTTKHGFDFKIRKREKKRTNLANISDGGHEKREYAAQPKGVINVDFSAPGEEEGEREKNRGLQAQPQLPPKPLILKGRRLGGQPLCNYKERGKKGRRTKPSPAPILSIIKRGKAGAVYSRRCIEKGRKDFRRSLTISPEGKSVCPVPERKKEKMAIWRSWKKQSFNPQILSGREGSGRKHPLRELSRYPTTTPYSMEKRKGEK